MNNLRFRSPLLQEMPATTDKVAEKAGRISGRVVKFIVAAGGSLLLLLTIARQLLPERGLGWMLYALHDYFYLPVKGYSFTYFFPYSLIWWLSISTILGLILLSRLIDRSFIKEPHIRLLSIVMRNPVLYDPLLKSVSVINSFGFSPDLIRLLAKRDWEKMLIQLSAYELNDAPRTLARRIMTLTLFRIQLEKIAPASGKLDDFARWSIRLIWHRTYLMLHAYCNDDLIYNLIDKARLVDLPAEPIATETAFFSPGQLENDLLHLKIVGEIEWGFSQVDRGEYEKSTSLNQLIHSVETRRQILYQAADILNNRLRFPKESREIEMSKLWPLETTIPSSLRPLMGEFARQIALHTAVILGEPRYGEAYLNLLDTLSFLLEVDAEDFPQREDLVGIVTIEPSLMDYRLIHLLLKQNLSQQYSIYEFELNSQDGVFDLDHFKIAKEMVTLWQIAGPSQRDLEEPV